MSEKLTVNTGLLLAQSHLAKLDRMSDALGVSRNGVVRLLIEAAQEPEPRPALVVGKLNSRNAQLSQGTGAAAVGA